VRSPQPEVAATPYTSSNLRKHTNPNPVQQWLLARFHRTAAGLLAQTGARSILDAGCGEGFAMRETLAHAQAAVVGVDATPGALQLARQLNPSRSFAAGDVLELPFPAGSFDLVICMEVLEHLARPEQGLAELKRVSRGWLLLSVPDEPFFRGANFLRGKNVRAWGNDPGHVNHWSSHAFLRFVSEQCGVVAWRRSFPWTLALCERGAQSV
jgi:2-polyprenyl-3-methyl-5-hydroxy-6-metoxy-1,4-benzoquinol methylase